MDHLVGFTEPPVIPTNSVIHLTMPILFMGCLVPPPIKPESSDIIVLCKLSDLRILIVQVGIPISSFWSPCFSSGPTSWIEVWMIPIQLRIINKQLKTMLLTRLFQQPKNIFFIRSGFHYCIIRHLRIIHGHSIMMFGGNGDVSHPSFFRKGDDGIRIKIRAITKRRQHAVPTLRYILVIHNPFPITKSTIYSPVNKHSKSGIFKPCSSFQVFL